MTDPTRNHLSLRDVIESHLARYPEMRAADLYKLLHQAVFGSEHAVGDPGQARAQLAAELAAADAGPEEPLVDPISGDGDIARVHLRAYRAAGFEPDLLAEAFLRTAAERRGSPEQVEAAWRIATEVTVERGSRFGAEELSRYFAARAAEGFPAMRHSEEYRRLYAPSYRVIRAAWLFPAP